MFICEKCQANYRIDSFYQLIGPFSYGPCELCHHTGTCLDYHGNLDPKVTLADSVIVSENAPNKETPASEPKVPSDRV